MKLKSITFSLLILIIGYSVAYVLSTHDTNFSPKNDMKFYEFLEGKWEYIDEDSHEKYTIVFFSKSYYSYSYVRMGEYPEEHSNVVYKYELLGEHTIKDTSIDTRQFTSEGYISRDGELLLLSFYPEGEILEYSRSPYFSWKEFGLYSFVSIIIWVAYLWVAENFSKYSISLLKPKINLVVFGISLPLGIVLLPIFNAGINIYMPWKLVIEIEFMFILFLLFVINKFSFMDNKKINENQHQNFLLTFNDYAYSVFIFSCIELIILQLALWLPLLLQVLIKNYW